MQTAIIATSSPVDITTYEQAVSACLKSSQYILSTKYYNVCTGEVYSIPVGTVDLLIAFVFGLTLTAITAMILRLVLEDT